MIARPRLPSAADREELNDCLYGLSDISSQINADNEESIYVFHKSAEALTIRFCVLRFPSQPRVVLVVVFVLRTFLVDR